MNDECDRSGWADRSYGGRLRTFGAEFGELPLQLGDVRTRVDQVGGSFRGQFGTHCPQFGFEFSDPFPGLGRGFTSGIAFGPEHAGR
jgi:hypothetical protein